MKAGRLNLVRHVSSLGLGRCISVTRVSPPGNDHELCFLFFALLRGTIVNRTYGKNKNLNECKNIIHIFTNNILFYILWSPAIIAPRKRDKPPVQLHLSRLEKQRENGQRELSARNGGRMDE